MMSIGTPVLFLPPVTNVNLFDELIKYKYKNSVSGGEWMADIKINNKRVKVQLDTGAKCNVMPLSVYKSLNIKAPIHQKATKLTSYTGHNIPIEGVSTLQCQLNNKTHWLEFYITKIDASTILGAQACTLLQILKRINNINKESTNPSTSPLPDILDEYPDVFKGLGCLPEKHNIKIDLTVTPVIHPPRRVPIALKDKVKQELDRMEREGVVVRQTDPTPWVNSMVTVVKPNKVRICIDPRDLNTAIKREHFPMKTIEEIIAEMPNAKVFTVLDATSGFWQVELDNESSLLNTPFGRYRYTRLPFGIKSAPEVFQRYMSQMLERITGADAIVDDILVWGSTVEEHDKRLRQVLERAQAYNLRLNKKNCQLRKNEVAYVGHMITKDGLKPDPEKVRAVVEMKPPQSLKALRTFLGFIQYLGKFLPNLATESTSLRQLLEKDVEWHWNETHQQSFDKLKEMVTSTPVLRYYDPSKPVLLSVDASSTGLGAVLVQEGKPVAFASRALTPAQQKYAQIEKELLAIVYGCNKFHQYVYGRTVHVESDHKPLEAIMQKNLNQAPLRLQRMLLNLQKYDLKVKYKPGLTMQLADTLSRNYLPESKEVLVDDLGICEITIPAHLPVTKPKYEEFKKATADDPVMQQLIDVVLEGWPTDKAHIPTDLRVYWTFRDKIAVLDGLLFKGPKLIVPHPLRNEMLDKIHEGHLGMVKCKHRAREVLYWPALSKDIEDKVSKCQICTSHQRQQPKEPLQPHEPPDRPWSKIGTDLYVMNNQHYLCTVDYYSKWIEMDKVSDETSKSTIVILKEHFARYGIPDEVISDNGPQFASKEFAKFAKDYEFTHTTTSPHYAQSNGQVERTVQTVKNLMAKSDDIHKALLSYRSTPLDVVNQSPAQLLMGRRIKTTLPTTAELLKPQSQGNVKAKLIEKAQMQKKYFDRHASKELPVLQKGEDVQMKHGKVWIPAKVTVKHHSPRSYVVQTTDGRKYRRNRRQLNRYRANDAIPKHDDNYQSLERSFNKALPAIQSQKETVTMTTQQQEEEEVKSEAIAPTSPAMVTRLKSKASPNRANGDTYRES